MCQPALFWFERKISEGYPTKTCLASFKEELEQALVDNLAKYFVMLPSEVAMKLWTVLGQGHLNNTIKLHQTTIEDATTGEQRSVSDYLVEILAGDQQNADD